MTVLRPVGPERADSGVVVATVLGSGDLAGRIWLRLDSRHKVFT